MPDCSGLDLLDEIKQQYPDTAVLMVTGDGESSKAVRALTRGAVRLSFQARRARRARGTSA